MDTEKLKQITGDNIPEAIGTVSDFVIPANNLQEVVELAASGDIEAVTEPLTLNAIEVADPIIKEIDKTTNKSLYVLNHKLDDADAVDKAGIGEIAGTVEKLVKLKQLLTGGVTDNIGVMAGNIGKRIIEYRSDLYD